LPSQEFLLSAFFWRTWIRLGPPPSRHLVNLLHFHQLGVTDGPQSGLGPYGIAPYNPPKHALECCRDALSLLQVGPSLPCLLLCSCQNVPECYCLTTWAAAVITGALSLGAPHAIAPPYIPIGQCKRHVISLRDYLTLFPGFVSLRYIPGAVSNIPALECYLDARPALCVSNIPALDYYLAKVKVSEMNRFNSFQTQSSLGR